MLPLAWFGNSVRIVIFSGTSTSGYWSPTNSTNSSPSTRMGVALMILKSINVPVLLGTVGFRALNEQRRRLLTGLLPHRRRTGRSCAPGTRSTPFHVANSSHWRHRSRSRCLHTRPVAQQLLRGTSLALSAAPAEFFSGTGRGRGVGHAPSTTFAPVAQFAVHGTQRRID